LVVSVDPHLVLAVSRGDAPRALAIAVGPRTWEVVASIRVLGLENLQRNRANVGAVAGKLRAEKCRQQCRVLAVRRRDRRLKPRGAAVAGGNGRQESAG